MQAQLTTAGTANQQAAEARQQANEDASRLRSELEKATAQRDQLQADLAGLQNELSRLALLEKGDSEEVLATSHVACFICLQSGMHERIMLTSSMNVMPYQM